MAAVTWPASAGQAHGAGSVNVGLVIVHAAFAVKNAVTVQFAVASELIPKIWVLIGLTKGGLNTT